MKLNNFRWSTLEQEYPFETSPTGEKLYCKMIALGHGTIPNKVVAHGIVGLNPTKIYRLFGRADSGSSGAFFPLPFTDHNVSLMSLYATDTYIVFEMKDDFTACDATAYIIYRK